jgi:hypothetical protein
MDAPPEPIPPAPMRTLDDIVGMVQDLMRRHWPKATFASVVIHDPDLPDVVIPVRPVTAGPFPPPAPSRLPVGPVAG